VFRSKQSFVWYHNHPATLKNNATLPPSLPSLSFPHTSIMIFSHIIIAWDLHLPKEKETAKRKWEMRICSFVDPEPALSAAKGPFPPFIHHLNWGFPGRTSIKKIIMENCWFEWLHSLTTHPGPRCDWELLANTSYTRNCPQPSSLDLGSLAYN